MENEGESFEDTIPLKLSSPFADSGFRDYRSLPKTYFFSCSEGKVRLEKKKKFLILDNFILV
jgi:hypothetical protein